MEQQLVSMVPQGGGSNDLQLYRDPKVTMREAEIVMAIWAPKVESLALFKKIGQGRHLFIEAWQMLGAMYGVTASIKETRYVDLGNGVNGWEATAQAIHMVDGRVISSADAMCLSDEEKWGPRPKYAGEGRDRKMVGYVPTPTQQLRSMAQTRACSKVLSNLFKWIVVQKGFNATPAEEMPEEGTGNGGAAAPRPQRRSAAAEPAATTAADNAAPAEPVVTEAQSKRMYAIAMNDAKLSKEEYLQFLKRHGFDHGSKVTVAKYEEMIKVLQSAPQS